MYNVAIHAQQVLGATVCYISLSETLDSGITYPLATAVSSSNLLASAEEDPLWIFTQQVAEAVSRALSTSQDTPGGLWRFADGVDGGWGGAGQAGRPERSEDDHA